ncbi:hypothetical protein D3C84_343940 [compost metagenome]
MHHANRLATVLGTNHFADQHRAGRPLAAETEAHQGPCNQQLLVALGKAAEEGEEGKPQHRQLQGANTTDAVGENTRYPAADGRSDQRAGVNQPGLAGGDAPHGNQGRHHEAEHLGVHAVQAIADLAAPEGAAFLLIDVAIPVERSRTGRGFRNGGGVGRTHGKSPR